MPGDLHNHTTCSDGSTPIQRLAPMAARAGLDVLAISDHDTLLSAEYCWRHPTQDGVRLIPAAELTGYDYERKHRVHLLCYYPQDCPELRAHCDTMRRRADAYNEARQKLFRLEREGRALVFTPTSTEGFHRTERDVDKIKALWKDGWDQGLARLDEAEAFLKGD